MLYGSETWGDFSNVHENLREIERKLLKRILGVKSGTTNDLTYHKLRRSEIVSRIKDKQCRFYRKLLQMPSDEAIVYNILEMCKNDKFISYYKNLHDHNYTDDIKERELRVCASDNSMYKYYVEMNFKTKVRYINHSLTTRFVRP